jgi:hypothetical protein
MGLIFKLIGVLTTLATTVLLLVNSLRGGLFVLGTILGIMKVVVIAAFLALLLVVLYVLFTSKKSPA